MKGEKLQRGINRAVTMLSALLSGEINSYEYLTGELPTQQHRLIEDENFSYFPLRKAFEKQENNWMAGERRPSYIVFGHHH